MPSGRLQTVEAFLADTPSLGPDEVAGGEFVSYDAADLDIKFVLALLKARDYAVSHIACVPDFWLCLHAAAPTLRPPLPEGGGCDSSSPSLRMQIRAGVVVVGTRTPRPRVLWPREAVAAINTCAHRFVVCNLGLYPSRDTAQGGGHANALLFDVRLRLIERFDPSGTRSYSVDPVLERRLGRLFPDWTYVGVERMFPKGHPGPQGLADAFAGLCVTYSLWYVLLRLLNPDVDPSEVVAHMTTTMGPTRLRDRALKLNRRVVDTLRAHPRGSLVRRGGPTVTRNRRHSIDCRQVSAARAAAARRVL